MNGFEITILDFIQQHFASEFMNPIMLFITRFGDAGIFWIAFNLVLLMIPKTRRVGAVMALALIFEALICNLAIKPFVARIRPFDLNTAAQLLLKAPTDFSFPSGHTGASFAVVGALLLGKNKLWIPAGILSVLIGFSRMYLYVHYPTDVLAGAVLGMITAWLAMLVVELAEKKFQEKKQKKQEEA